MSSAGRLLVVTESLGVGGTESHLLRLLPRLAAGGWKIAVFCLTEAGSRAGEIEAEGIEVHAMPAILDPKGSIRYPAHAALAAAKLYRLARNWRPDLVHFYLPAPYLIGAPVAMAARVPVRIMSRRSLSLYQRSWPAAARLERLLHRRMHLVIGNSRAVVEELRQEGVAEAKLRLIYNGIALAEPKISRAEARSALGLDAEALVGVVVANLIPYKGHVELIEGLALAASGLPPGWRVLLAGRDQGLKAALEALAQSRGIAGNVEFLGERSDIPRLLAAADFGLLTSREEGFSNVILEAMAAGLPMIVTRVGGNPEAVLDGETGLVVPPRDPEAIGDAVLRLARDPELRRKCGTAARARAAAEFSIEHCAAAHRELYQALLAAHRREAPA